MGLFQRASRRKRTCNNYRPQFEQLETRLAPATLPAGFTESIFAGNGAPLTRATTMEFSPDGNYLFIAEQAGTMEVWQNGVRVQENFFASSPLQINSAGERGLLGIAFDPEFDSNHHVYVYYTASTPRIHNRVSRFTVDPTTNRAVAGSQQIILELPNLGATNHNGGAIHFGPDDKLYIATGENASPANAQSLNTLLGKILRINKDGTIPEDNPFFNTASGQNRAIWALGLRNPYTFAFQPGTGRMYINDVGQDVWEEINEGIAGANYNWPQEGPFTPPNPNPQKRTPPVHAYNHGLGCAITGGTFYNPDENQFPSQYVGDYFYSDFCGGWIYHYDIATDTATVFADDIGAPVDLRTGPDGSLYYLSRGNGRVYRIQYTQRDEPTVILQPETQTVAETETATFTVEATGLAPLSYQWQRLIGDAWTNIDGATSTTLVVDNVQPSDDGALFRVVVSNTAGSDNSLTAMLDVTLNNAPVARITAPVLNARYRAGSRYLFAGIATDKEDGRLHPNNYAWSIDFYHKGAGDTDYHVHPFMQDTSGITRGIFTIPNSGEKSTDVFYRVNLTATDSLGRTTTVFRDIVPIIVTLTLQTNATDLQLLVDSQAHAAPYVFTSVVGMKLTLEAPLTQTVNGIDYLFHSWSTRKAATHEIVTPTRNATYTTSYVADPSDWQHKINFQPFGRPIPDGYSADYGDVFGLRDNGLTYGWNVDNRRNARDRNVVASPDQRYDTVNYLQPARIGYTWEIALAPGTYQVHVVAGDATGIGGHYAVDVEGTLAIDARATSATRWFDAVVTVTITAEDPFLTISTAPGAIRNRLSFVEIRPLS